MTEQMADAKPLSGQELAGIIRTFREMRQWSQDTLAAISKLNIRTVQRVESGEPSNADTRRALALACELEDIDVFNQPFSMPDPEQIQAEMEKFKRENLTLEARVVGSEGACSSVRECTDGLRFWGRRTTGHCGRSFGRGY
jgi:transcriptional regulator with XRE-family HTH domain